MGRVLVEAKVENIGDVWNAEQGMLDPTKVRSIVIPDALVDSGATLLSLPPSMIAALGLGKFAEKAVKTSAGPKRATVYSPVRLTIQGRSCTVDVMEVPEGIPALVGYIPLENLDFLIDPKAQKLTGNPAHNYEHMYDQY